MGLPVERTTRLSISEAGYDEVWLQNGIIEDPSLLGLGPLESLDRERRQRAGGRIDILLADHESKTMFEVETMLGALDESHLVRAIEYWDKETRRYQEWNHRPVIVAEQITHRFFNVVALLSRYIPFLGIQVNVHKTSDNRVFLAAVQVLDAYERPQEEETASLAPDQKLHMAFWRDLIATARTRTKLHAACVPTKNSWLRHRTGLKGVFFDYEVDEDGLWVGLTVERSDAKCKLISDQLKSEEKEIEKAFGTDLAWDGGRGWAWLGTLAGPSFNLRDQRTWPTAQAAAVDSMVRLESALRAPLESLSMPE